LGSCCLIPFTEKSKDRIVRRPEAKKTLVVGKRGLRYIDSYIATRHRNYYNILLTRQDVGNQKYMTVNILSI
jgi:hypothetical protein